MVSKNLKPKKVKRVVKKTKISKLNKFFMLVKNNLVVSLLILIVIFLGTMIIFLAQDSKKSYYKDSDDNDLEVYLVGKEECEECDINSLIENIEKYTNLDFNIKEVSKEKFESNFYPVLLFDEDIKKVAGFETGLKEAFDLVEYKKKSHYKLKDEIVKQTKPVKLEESLNYDGGVLIGNKNAKITLYEISDFECPYCAIAHNNEEIRNLAGFSNYNPIFPNIIDEYVESGIVNIVFINYPVPELNHLNANDAHNAAMCANEQEKFKEYSNELFVNQNEWKTGTLDPEEKLKSYAEKISLNLEEFNNCYSEKRYDSQILEDKEFVRNTFPRFGTPTFILDTQIIQGAQDYSVIKNAIERLR